MFQLMCVHVCVSMCMCVCVYVNVFPGHPCLGWLDGCFDLVMVTLVSMALCVDDPCLLRLPTNKVFVPALLV